MLFSGTQEEEKEIRKNCISFPKRIVLDEFSLDS
jgi:hypothetical protein